MDSCVQDKHSVDMDISMDIHRESVDMDMDMDGKFHIHGKPEYGAPNQTTVLRGKWAELHQTLAVRRTTIGAPQVQKRRRYIARFLNHSGSNSSVVEYKAKFRIF